MTPEAGYFLAKANKLLGEAEAMLTIDLHDAAGRTAYLAAFHAAQAFISENTGRSVKTHMGVHGELYRLTKSDANIDPEVRIFLSQSYELKSIADYETGPDAEVTADQATAAIAGAKRFIAYFSDLLGDPAAQRG